MWHWVRQRPAIAAALVLVPVLAILLTPLALQMRPQEIPPVDPDLPLKEVEDRLAKGEKVELIGLTGAPKWLRSVVGGQRTHNLLAPDGTFTVDSWEDLSLLELVTNPHRDTYVITAKVRHEKSNDLGEVGIYCGRYAYDYGEKSINSFVYLAFNDIGDEVDRFNKLNPQIQALKPKPTGNMVFFSNRLVGRKENKTIFDDVPDQRDRANVFKPAGPHGGDWRTLIVRFSPNRVESYWEKEQFVAAIPIDGLAKLADKFLFLRIDAKTDTPGFQKLHADFPCRGGIGLYVSNSTASFCSVTIDP
jgi:serine/threonine-protein kinase